MFMETLGTKRKEMTSASGIDASSPERRFARLQPSRRHLDVAVQSIANRMTRRGVSDLKSSHDRKLEPDEANGVHSDGRKSADTHSSGRAQPNAWSIQAVYADGSLASYTGLRMVTIPKQEKRIFSFSCQPMLLP